MKRRLLRCADAAGGVGKGAKGAWRDGLSKGACVCTSADDVERGWVGGERGRGNKKRRQVQPVYLRAVVVTRTSGS